MDVSVLQRNLDTLVKKAADNHHCLNLNKCQIMRFCKTPSVLTCDYRINQSSLSNIDKVKDLGMIFDSNLKFSEHVSYVTTKAFRSLSFLIRLSIILHLSVQIFIYIIY